MGKSVLILGGSSDISIALAHKLASDGYNIQFVVRNITAIKRIERDIELRYGVNVKSFYFDVLDMENIDLFLEYMLIIFLLLLLNLSPPFIRLDIAIQNKVLSTKKSPMLSIITESL